MPSLAIAIVAHVSRAAQASKLQLATNGVVFLDDGTLDGAGNHLRALEWAATQQATHALILEDDAVLTDGWKATALEYAAKYPGELVSLYLGTGRPPQWQPVIERKLRRATDHIDLPTLIHGVAYMLPVSRIRDLLDVMATSRIEPIDFRIGAAWPSPVVYAWPSIVDHADGPTISEHPDGQPRIEPRKAWAVRA